MKFCLFFMILVIFITQIVPEKIGSKTEEESEVFKQKTNDSPAALGTVETGSQKPIKSSDKVTGRQTSNVGSTVCFYDDNQ